MTPTPALLPDELAPGTQTVTVCAVDEFGQVHHAHRVLEVLGSSAASLAPVHHPD